MFQPMIVLRHYEYSQRLHFLVLYDVLGHTSDKEENTIFQKAICMAVPVFFSLGEVVLWLLESHDECCPIFLSNPLLYFAQLVADDQLGTMFRQLLLDIDCWSPCMPIWSQVLLLQTILMFLSFLKLVFYFRLVTMEVNNISKNYRRKRHPSVWLVLILENSRRIFAFQGLHSPFLLSRKSIPHGGQTLLA